MTTALKAIDGTADLPALMTELAAKARAAKVTFSGRYLPAFAWLGEVFRVTRARNPFTATSTNEGRRVPFG